MGFEFIGRLKLGTDFKRVSPTTNQATHHRAIIQLHQHELLIKTLRALDLRDAPAGAALWRTLAGDFESMLQGKNPHSEYLITILSAPWTEPFCKANAHHAPTLANALNYAFIWDRAYLPNGSPPRDFYRRWDNFHELKFFHSVQIGVPEQALNAN